MQRWRKRADRIIRDSNRLKLLCLESDRRYQSIWSRTNRLGEIFMPQARIRYCHCTAASVLHYSDSICLRPATYCAVVFYKLLHPPDLHYGEKLVWSQMFSWFYIHFMINIYCIPFRPGSGGLSYLQLFSIVPKNLCRHVVHRFKDLCC